MKLHYCHPLIRTGGERYISAPKEEVDGLPLARWDDLKGYITAHFTSKHCVVELNDKTFHADVWIPNDDTDDYSYIIGDIQGNPEGEFEEAGEINTTQLYADIRAYAQNLSHGLGYSEALAPDERSHLATEFIRPEFDWFQLDNNALRQKKQFTVDEVITRQRIVVLGDPGAGKTSFVRWLALKSATEAAEKPEVGIVPLYLRLASISREISLRQALACEADRIGASWLSLCLFQLAEIGRIQFILDGLDEVPDSSQNRVLEELRDLSASFPLAGMVVTCRPVVYKVISLDFAHFRIRPFSGSQIAEWTFRRLLNKPARSWKTFAAYVFANKDLLQMVSNPLLLNIATHVYTRQNTLPASRTVLMQTWLDALLNQWDHVRAVTRSTEYWASPRRRYNALCHAAFHTCDREVTSFREDEYLLWEESHGDGQDARETLRSLEAHCGVVRRSTGTEWSFLHQVLLEHCAAAYLVEGSEDLAEKLRRRMEKPLWQNIWMQACALSQDSTELVEMVLDHPNLEDSQKCRLLFKAFTQPIRCDRSILDRCVIAALKLLVTLSAKVTFVVSPSRGTFKAEVRSSAKKSRDPRKLLDLMDLVEAIYAGRRSEMTQLLLANDVEKPVIATVAAACKVDGEFSFHLEDARSGMLRIDKPSSLEFWESE